MQPLLWMIGASVLSWLVVATVGGSRVNPELLAGMIAPLASEGATWVAVARTHAANPGRVMNVLMAAFAAKMVFFGVYVAVALRPLGLRPVPFVVSFTSYFIGLYAMEALFLKRLLADPRASSRA